MWGAFLSCAGMGMLALLGAFLLYTGRLGPDSRWGRRYQDKDIDSYFRNGPFAMLPFGVTLLIFAAGVLVDEGSRARTVLLAFGFPLLIFSVIVPFFPPVWLKPRWVREMESR